MWNLLAVIIISALVALAFGYKDLLRISLTRIWAISGVCFSESIRRRILWITPLAILGVIIVAQLQKPVDEQDAIRQTTKFCLFSTGLVVVISTIILACSSLPREIENRVIFTVVTKPTTRLEIVLGKIVGFARVSAAILIIMGLFTWGYLHLRAWTLEHDIKARLASGDVEIIAKPTLQHYVDAGLLNAKTLATPASLNIYARTPKAGDPRRYFTSDGYVLIPFVLPPDTIAAADPDATQYKGPGMIIHLRVGYNPASLSKPAPVQSKHISPLVASTQAISAPPSINVRLFDSNQNIASTFYNGPPLVVASPDGQSFDIPVPVSAVVSVTKWPFIYVELTGQTGGVQYWLDNQPGELLVPVVNNPQPVEVLPQNSPEPLSAKRMIFLGHQGTYGQQIKGDAPDVASVGVYTFRDLNMGSSCTVPIEMRIGLERSGEDVQDVETPASMSLTVINRQTGQSIDAGILKPENNRTVYGTLPAAAVTGGDFDVVVRCLSLEQWISITPTSLTIVQSESIFGWNLMKSLLILWLLTILVVAISIFCSTFLSWPIAIVLTLVILLSHWGVTELGDANGAGLGRQFVQDFGVSDPATSLALSKSVEQLNKLLGTVATVLPDIGQFSATEDIERGISIPMHKIVDALSVLAGFGIPLSVLAYVILKNKEVAP